MKSVQHFIKTFKPNHYTLFLDINRKDKQFTGHVSIQGEAFEKKISLHQKALTITSVTSNHESLAYEMDDDNEAVHIILQESGEYTVELDFSGHITDNMTGIYPSYYTVNGVKKEVISTQFESHFAREAFPSVDEPEAKATFDLSLRFDQSDDEIALSNMPEVNPDKRKETGVWTFERTPKMSSYLLAFAFGDLQSKMGQTKNGTEVGIFSTKAHDLSSLDFALDIAIKAIEFYEDYYGVKYPIPHSYHLALPDFSAGAMENWGLVTYREIYLLVDKNSTLKSRQILATVIAHELAHQWFGNLVTMKWWDDLWLNESFANMMEYVSIDAIKPDWHIFEDFQTSGVPLALSRDATDGVQSVHVAVHHPDEINTLFDPAIVYAKGSRLMHMLRRWLGDKAFSQGLHRYFEQHQYSNTVGTDLWTALSEVSGRNVADFMTTWLEQPGYPVLNVHLENDTLVISQKQFFIGEHEDKGRLWQIPLNPNWKGLPEILSEETIRIDHYSQLKKENGDKPLRFNTENTAHYITNYHDELLDAILADVNHLDNITLLQLLQERQLLAESGIISYGSLVPLLKPLAKEKSYLVVSAINHILSGLKQFIEEGSEDEEAFHALVRSLFRFNYDRLGFIKKENEDAEDETVRQITISWMLIAQDSAALKEADQLFNQYADKISDLPAAIRGAILSNQVRQAENKDLIDLYLMHYRTATDGSFKRQLANALANTHDKDTLDSLVTLFKDKDTVKPQDLSGSWYLPFLSHSFTQEVVWQWGRDNWEWIQATLGGDMSSDRFIIYPANVFKTQKRLDEYKTFFSPMLSEQSMKRNILMGEKEIAARIEMIGRDEESVLKYLKN